MPVEVFDEYNIRGLSDEERFLACERILKYDQDESKRWDAVWLAGELAENRDKEHPLFSKVADLMEWVLENDDNGVVKHEACFQIAARNFRQKIPALIKSAFFDSSNLTKHEAIEALGLMRAFDVEDKIAEAQKDSNQDVRETATFVSKRFARLKKNEEYKPYNIL